MSRRRPTIPRSPAVVSSLPSRFNSCAHERFVFLFQVANMCMCRFKSGVSRGEFFFSAQEYRIVGFPDRKCCGLNLSGRPLIPYLARRKAGGRARNELDKSVGRQPTGTISRTHDGKHR